MNSCAWIRPCALDGVRWCSACGLWQLQFEVHSAGARLQGVAGGHEMKLFYWWDVNLFRLLGCQDARRRQLSFFKNVLYSSGSCHVFVSQDTSYFTVW
mgnify:CR=1 FL=1